MEDHHHVTVDSLSYKELQTLAMSLNLPGKMKSGVLVEAIKARQSHNEQAVAAILEANRQRRIFRRQQQLDQKQKQTVGAYPTVGNKRVTTTTTTTFIATRSHYKRSAHEMADPPGPLVIDESVNKRSRLEVMLQQQQIPHHQQQQVRRPMAQYHSYASVRKLEAGYNPSPWDSRQVVQPPAVLPPSLVEPSSSVLVPTAQSMLSPELKPVVLPPASSNDTCSMGSLSSGSSSWSNPVDPSPSTVAIQPQGGDGGYDDSGWMTGDDSFSEFNNTTCGSSSWRNLPNNVPKMPQQPDNNNNNSHGFPLLGADGAASTSAYFDEDIFGSAPYHPDELINDVQQQQQPVTAGPSHGTPTLDTYAGLLPPEGTPLLPPKPLPQLICTFDYAVHHPDPISLFRTQRPGNPVPIFVHSGRGVIYPTFCLTLPRVASYVQ